MNAGEIALFTLKKGSVSLAYLLGAEILCNSKDCNANAIHRMNMISSNLSRKRTVTGEVKLMPIIRTPPPVPLLKFMQKYAFRVWLPSKSHRYAECPRIGRNYKNYTTRISDH